MEQIDEQRFFTMAETYDRMCRLLVPKYDFLQDEVLDLLPIAPDQEAVFVDLGAGSGILLEKVLARWPRAKCYWVDYSQDFFQVAREKLACFDGRAEYILSPIEADWESQIGGQVDAILSMSAIHHLEETEKKTLYRRCWETLRPGGWFFNIDEMKTISQDAYLSSMHLWIKHVQETRQELAADRLPDYQKWKNRFDNWELRNVVNIGKPKTKGDDIHQDFISQVNWLREIGFSKVDVFIKYHLWCAIGGRKLPTRARSKV